MEIRKEAGGGTHGKAILLGITKYLDLFMEGMVLKVSMGNGICFRTDGAEIPL